MKILVAVKQVAALDEDFAIRGDGRDIDPDFLIRDLNEWDDFSLEEAVKIKEGAAAPVEVVAVQVSVLPEETLDADRLVAGSTQVTVLIAVGWTRVKLCVPVNVDCTCEVAVTVTTLLVGTVPGAVYNPPLEIDPLPVPLTVQFTSVLLRFTTIAVH